MMQKTLDALKEVREKMERGEYVERMLLSSIIGEVFEWDKWIRQIPKLQFEPDWNVTIIPPFCGAIVRFYIEKGNNRVSVYLDCYDVLGYFGSPYWEIYPDVAGDNARFAIGETTQLLDAIRESLNADD